MNCEKYAPCLFCERQYFASWVYLALLAVILGSFGPFIGMELPEDTGASIIVCIVACIPLGFIVVINVFRLNTEVRSDSIYIYFGIFFPMIWKTISLSAITEVRTVEYRPLRDAGGWGWRCGRFEKQKTWFYNAIGNKGVLICTSEGRRYILGSQQPEKLAEAVEHARSGAR